VTVFTKRLANVAHRDSDAVDLWFPSVCDEYYLHRGSFFNLGRELEEFELTSWCLNEGTERLYPITAVVVSDAVNIPYLGFVNVTTDNAVISTTTCVLGHVMLKLKNKVCGTLKVLFDVLGE